MKGQSLHHICANHVDEIMLNERSLYNYVDDGIFAARDTIYNTVSCGIYFCKLEVTFSIDPCATTLFTIPYNFEYFRLIF
jgi:hypothetical protein